MSIYCVLEVIFVTVGYNQKNFNILALKVQIFSAIKHGWFFLF